jgi:hypothetical protein
VNAPLERLQLEALQGRRASLGAGCTDREEYQAVNPVINNIVIACPDGGVSITAHAQKQSASKAATLITAGPSCIRTVRCS